MFPGSTGIDAVTQAGFWDNFFNSLIVALSCTLLTVALSVMSSYYISLYPKTNKLSFWVLSLRMMPPIASLIPYYLMVSFVGLVDSIVSLILINVVFNIPIAIWLISSYFAKIPKSYKDIASIDGLSHWKFLLKILLPLSKPAIITSALLTFIFTWNEFLFAVVLTGVRAKTLPVLATGFITQRGILWGQLTATAVIMILPIVVLTLTFYKYFIDGISLGLKKE